MEILLTGFTAFLTQEWIETTFPNDHVLTTCAKGEALSDTQIKTVTLESRQLLDQLAETYQFDRVVYFSEYLLPHGDQEGELDRLRRVLQSCREREVELLYLSGPEAAFAPSTGKRCWPMRRRNFASITPEPANFRSRCSACPTCMLSRPAARISLRGYSNRCLRYGSNG